MDPGSEDFDVLENRSSSNPPSEEDDLQAQVIVFYPNKSPVAYKLHAGVNVVGRRSSLPERDHTRLKEWTEEFSGEHVHGLFLESSSVSSAHAAIYLEPWSELCFVKDLKSRNKANFLWASPRILQNKTFLKQSGGHHKAIEPHMKCPLHSGGSLTLGALRCRISFGASFEGLPTPSTTISNLGRSSAMVIGDTQTGAPEGGSLDKCPSLQEWFCHPAARRHSPPREPSLRLPLNRSSDSLELTNRSSFGFNALFHDEDHTSSDAEPVTPRIDRPQAFGKAKAIQAQLQASGAGLAPMLEDEREGEDPDEFPEAAREKGFATESGQLGAEASEQASAMEDLTHSSDIQMHSPAASLTEEEAEHLERSIRSTRLASPLKRTRSGRQHPDRSRSKSPRLQRGFAVREPSFRLEEMREAVSKIGTDA